MTLTVLAALALPAAAEDGDSTLRYWAEAVASRVKVTGYAQAGYTAAMNEGAPNTNSFEMKRAILMVAADITPRFYAFFMHDFKSGDMQEYYMEYRPAREFRVRFGQSKTELSMENPMSPTVLESIGPMSQGVFWLCGADPLMGNPAGRDLGLMVSGDLFGGRLRYVAEVVNGGQTNASDRDNRKNLIAKLEYSPVGNLRLSVSAEKGYGTAVAQSAYNPQVGMGDVYRHDCYAAGAEWKSKASGSDWFRHRCAMVRAELLGGRDAGVGSTGGYVSAAVPVYKGLDIVAMADYFNYNTTLKLANTNLMAGLQYWIHRKCRLQVQYTYSMPSSAKQSADGLAGNYSRLQTQVQVAF